MRTKNVQLTGYDEQIARKRLAILAAVVLAITVCLYSVMAGSIELTLGEVLKALVGRGTGQADTVVLGIRLPRVVTSLLVGAALAVSGAVMQCVLQNPLASASTLGVSQGIVVFGGGVVNSGSSNVAVEVDDPYIVTTCAFVFGSLSTVVVLALSQVKRDLGPGGLVLAGVALSSLFTGGSTLLQYFADETQLGAVVFWTFGNLGSTGWMEILILAVIFAGAYLFFLCNRWNYNAMRSGADTAKSLGVNTRAVMLASMAVCTLTAAVSVAFVGIISFVGLVAPHMMR